MKKNMKKIFGLYMLLFFSLIIYILKFSLIDSQHIKTNSYNPRVGSVDENIKRGTVYDSKGDVLAESIKTETGYKREYPYSEQFAHIVGFMSNGYSGVELYYNFELESLDNELYQRILNIFTDDFELQGNNIRLTLNSKLQKYVYKKIGKTKGAVVAIEPKTGKILSMVSYPTFNPSTVAENWKTLSSDENSPLINRASQGLYPPGSTFKIVTAAAEIETDTNWKNFSHKCKGEVSFSDKKIRCFNSTVHGKVDLKEALQYSCNTFFSLIGNNLGGDVLHLYAEKAMFNKPIYYPLEYKQSSFVLTSADTTSELVQTAIGQGKTLVSPLHMTLIVSAAANGGVMMKPYIVDSIESYDQDVLKQYSPSKLADVFDKETSDILKDMMKSVVTSGTAIEAKTKNIQIAGKTGTAENASGKDHSWFIAFAPADNPQIVVGVILENAGRGNKAVPMTRDIISYYLNELNEE